MKIKTLFISILIAAGSLNTSNAQAQTIGFYESDKVLAKIPEYSGIKQQLDVLSKGWNEDIKELEEEIAEMQLDFEAKEILYTEEIRNQRRQEIEQKVKQKDTFIAQKFGPQGEYFSRQRELLEPIQRQVFTALKTVADRKNMDFVFDRSGDLYLVYANNEWNITNDILMELGIEVSNN